MGLYFTGGEDMGEKRQSRRLPYRKRIRLGKDEPKYMGYASNISESGLEIESRNLYPPGTRIVISFQEDSGLEDNAPEARIEGIVKWSTRTIGNHSGNMGIEIALDSDQSIRRIYTERIKRLTK
ncbi:MAG: PilZ domain-containing protein [Candidatus Dadabacteria bacterium]|nr:PilZ domain-containing protein [Candidatus Dadabacteria bacterium]